MTHLEWNLYLGPILLGISVFLQVLFFFRPHISFLWVILAAYLTSFVVYMDTDVALFVGQLLLLPLLWLRKAKK